MQTPRARPGEFAFRAAAKALAGGVAPGLTRPQAAPDRAISLEAI